MLLYKHFASDQRNQLSVLLVAGLAQKEIAKLLNKTELAISQKLKRNPTSTKTAAKAPFGNKISIQKESTEEKLIVEKFKEKNGDRKIISESIHTWLFV